MFASRVDNRRRGELYEQCIVPTYELRPSGARGILLAMQEESPSSEVFEPEHKEKIPGILAEELLVQIACISKIKHQKNIQEAKLKVLQHSGCLSCFFLIQVYFHMTVSGTMRRILPSPHCFPSPFTMVHFKSSCPL